MFITNCLAMLLYKSPFSFYTLNDHVTLQATLLHYFTHYCTYCITHYAITLLYPLQLSIIVNATSVTLHISLLCFCYFRFHSEERKKYIC